MKQNCRFRGKYVLTGVEGSKQYLVDVLKHFFLTS